MKVNSNAMSLAAVAALAFGAGRLGFLAGPGPEAAAQSPGHGAEEDMPPEVQAMLEAGTPGDHHRHLDQFIGAWTGEFTTRAGPDAPPLTSRGTVVREWILGGRFVKETVEAKSDTGTFTGLGFIGYNNFDGRYEMVWMDNLSTALYTEKGTYHTAEKVLHSRGEQRDPATGRVINSWSKLDLSDPDRQVMVGYATDVEGLTFKAVEAVLIRSE